MTLMAFTPLALNDSMLARTVFHAIQRLVKPCDEAADRYGLMVRSQSSPIQLSEFHSSRIAYAYAACAIAQRITRAGG